LFIVPETGYYSWFCQLSGQSHKILDFCIERIRQVMPVFQGDSGGKRDPSSRRLWTALREIDRYLSSQSTWLVNYAERHRAGLRVGT